MNYRYHGRMQIAPVFTDSVFKFIRRDPRSKDEVRRPFVFKFVFKFAFKSAFKKGNELRSSRFEFPKLATKQIGRTHRPADLRTQ